MVRAFWASIFVLWFFWSPSQAQSEGEKKRAIEYAPLGALITDVGDFDRQEKRFDATFWLWTLTANPEDNPIADLSFPNAIEIKESLIHQEKTLQGFWITRKVRGTFRHAWNMEVGQDVRRPPRRRAIALAGRSRACPEVIRAVSSFFFSRG